MASDPFKIGKVDATRSLGGTSHIQQSGGAGPAAQSGGASETSSASQINTTDAVDVSNESEEAGGSAGVSSLISALNQNLSGASTGSTEVQGVEPGMKAGNVVTAGAAGATVGGPDPGMAGGGVFTQRPPAA